jgi:predicted PurR-regulated permease PerM
MQLFKPDWSENTSILIRVFTALGVLLLALAILALISNILDLLNRFRTELYLFVLGALLAYLMAPAVRVLQRVVRKPWAAVLSSYLLLFAAVLVFGVLLLTPFISQARSLVKNLQSPSAASLVPLQEIRRDIGGIQTELGAQQHALAAGRPILLVQVQQTRADIARLLQQTARLTATATSPTVAPIPPSYAGPVVAPVNALAVAYRPSATSLDAVALAHAFALANDVSTQANRIYAKAASTPLLLLSLQSALDAHGIAVDLHDRFSEVLQTVNNQVSSLLNNALGVSLQAGTLLLDVVLIFIISIYFIRDGARFVRWLTGLAPPGSRPQVARAVSNLDQILGSYLRTQVVLALLAGIADSVGALILGIPYAIVIFFSSFLLSLVPVLGPVLLPLPPLGIALIFSPLPRPLIYLLWLLIGEQAVTNVVGPRLQARNLRIHPLEAMAAALAGLPLAGLAGAFFAVPIVAFCHIVVREVASARSIAPPVAAPSTSSSPSRTTPVADASRP